jgi:hypothetical protein
LTDSQRAGDVGYAGLATVNTPAQAFVAAGIAEVGNGALLPSQSTLIASLTASELRHRALPVAVATEPQATQEAGLERLWAEDADVRLAALYGRGLVLERERRRCACSLPRLLTARGAAAGRLGCSPWGTSRAESSATPDSACIDEPPDELARCHASWSWSR